MKALIDGLNLALVADSFLVLLSFIWWVVALAGQAIGIPLGLKLWYQLLEPVFTPALGILMAGAILSGIVSQITKRLSSPS
jgi:hypothetical protein